MVARYATAKLERLEPINARLDLLRLQIRLLGGWISQQARLHQPGVNA